MTSAIATSPRFKFFDANGNPAAYYLLNTYAAGSLTPKTTWKNQDQTTANTNPITLDANGECILWIDEAQEYKFVLTTPLGTVVSTDDNISGADHGLASQLRDSSGSSLVGFVQSVSGVFARTVQDKLREMVSVKDFGAVGDGVTNDRLAIKSLFEAVKSNGGGLIIIPPGDYLISGQDGYYDIPELDSTIQYAPTSYAVQIYMQGLRNVVVLCLGQFVSEKTDGGITFLFDACSNLTFINPRLRGATVMSGEVPTVVGTSGLCFTSISGYSSNITVHNPTIDSHYAAIDIPGDPASPYSVRGVSITGCCSLRNGYYGIALRGNGNSVSVDNAYSYKHNRPFFVYDTSDVRMRMVSDEANGGYQALVKAYTTNTRNIEIDYTSKNKANLVTPRVGFQVQHNPALQPTPAYIGNVDLTYTEHNSGAGGVGIKFEYYRDAVSTATSSSVIFSNIKIKGRSANTLTSGVALTSDASSCLLDISQFEASNGYAILDGTGFVGCKKKTYTPVLSFGGASVGITYSVQSGEYFIAGGLCFVSGRVALTSKGGSTGYAEITLPLKTREFTALNPVIDVQLDSVSSISGGVSGYAVVPDSTLVRIRMQGATGTASITDANFTATSSITFSAVFPV